MCWVVQGKGVSCMKYSEGGCNWYAKNLWVTFTDVIALHVYLLRRIQRPMQFYHNVDLKVAKAPSDPLPLFKGQGLVCLVVAVGEPWLTKKHLLSRLQ